MDNCCIKKKSRQTKVKLHKRWLLIKSKKDEERFKNYWRIFQRVSTECESKYYKALFTQKINCIRQLWKNWTTVCYLKGKKSAVSTVPSLSISGKMIDNLKDISNKSNEYFNTIVDNLICTRTNIQTDTDF